MTDYVEIAAELIVIFEKKTIATSTINGACRHAASTMPTGKDHFRAGVAPSGFFHSSTRRAEKDSLLRFGTHSVDAECPQCREHQ